eukprot:TRINITY_DN12851_c0_g1_i9.p1 TRINITY_DN12851_c0_g1~~TRINITY_DN12851_c0_g1_i9.p1  ORF type:complete len:156 (-),score=38.69 TRINITY_DN12851_c0_g1_i9:30-449(-)
MDITGKSDTVSSSSQKVNEDEFVPSETGSKIGVGEVGEKSGEWKENILERAASAFKKEEDIMQLVYGSSLKEKKKKTKIKKKDKSTLDLFGEGDDDEKGNEDEKDESDAEDFFKIRKPVEIGRAVQQECRDRSRMPSSA